MVNFADLLTPERILLLPTMTSKKRTLETLAELWGTGDDELASAIFDCLIQREHLGSTGLGEGIALPHGRLSAIQTAQAAFLKLDQPIEFEAPDHRPVDLVFGLIVPEHYTTEHLKIIAQVAERLRQPEFCKSLRAIKDPKLAYQKWVSGH